MRKYQASLFTVLAVSAVAVSIAATRPAASEEAMSLQPSVSPQVRKACGSASRLASTSFAEPNMSTQAGADTRGPKLFDESSKASWGWGSCIDCSSCLSSADCAHVGGPCYEHCP